MGISLLQSWSRMCPLKFATGNWPIRMSLHEDVVSIYKASSRLPHHSLSYQRSAVCQLDVCSPGVETARTLISLTRAGLITGSDPRAYFFECLIFQETSFSTSRRWWRQLRVILRILPWPLPKPVSCPQEGLLQSFAGGGSPALPDILAVFWGHVATTSKFLLPARLSFSGRRAAQRRNFLALLPNPDEAITALLLPQLSECSSRWIERHFIPCLGQRDTRILWKNIPAGCAAGRGSK